LPFLKSQGHFLKRSSNSEGGPTMAEPLRAWCPRGQFPPALDAGPGAVRTSAGNAQFGPSEANAVIHNFNKLDERHKQDLLNFLRSL